MLDEAEIYVPCCIHLINCLKYNLTRLSDPQPISLFQSIRAFICLSPCLSQCIFLVVCIPVLTLVCMSDHRPISLYQSIRAFIRLSPCLSNSHHVSNNTQLTYRSVSLAWPTYTHSPPYTGVPVNILKVCPVNTRRRCVSVHLVVRDTHTRTHTLTDLFELRQLSHKHIIFLLASSVLPWSSYIHSLLSNQPVFRKLKVTCEWDGAQVTPEIDAEACADNGGIACWYEIPASGCQNISPVARIL